jgi:hypothetical protein
MDFGVLSAESLTDYLRALIDIAHSQSGSKPSARRSQHWVFEDLEEDLDGVAVSSLSDADASVIKRAIETAHNFVREHVGEAAVSQRDLHRVFKLWRFLLGHACARARRVAVEGRPSRRALLNRTAAIAVGIVYYLRLSPSHRTKLDQLLCGVGLDSVAEAVDGESNAYMQAVPEAATPGVTRNAALKENVFAITVCTQVRVVVVQCLVSASIARACFGKRGLLKPRQLGAGRQLWPGVRVVT